MPNKKCLACLNEITERAIFLSTTDNQQREMLLKKLKQKTEREFEQIKLPDYSTEIFRIIAEETGTKDPFLEIKKESNQHFKALILDIVDSFNGMHMKDIMFNLFLYSIGANMVDFSTGGHTVDIKEIANQILSMPEESLAINDFYKLYDCINTSQKVILLSDNCGEVVVDNLIVELLVSSKRKEVYFGLKGGPVANDCSLEDFKRDELLEIATENFAVSSSFGWNLHQTTPRFKELLETADLLIVKGQSNYETTLNNLVRYPNEKFPPIFCVLRTKCQVITDHLGVPLGSNVIKQMHPMTEVGKKSLTEIVDCK
ncbi:MAG: damage-control phosphatase ARMT1 family protein [Candidatus Heimdallarchaeota archaeon]